MTLFTRILALLLVLGVVFAAPVSMAASLVSHADQSHECSGADTGACHGAADEQSGGAHDCPCACHAQLPVAVVVAPVPVNGPRVMLVDWLRVGDPLPVEGLLAGVEHPPQNA